MTYREEQKAKIHPSHQLGKTRVEIRCPASTPRFYSIRKCIWCDAETMEHAAGLFIENELFEPCVVVENNNLTESENFKFEFRFEDKMYLQNLADKDERIEILTGECNMLKDELDRQRDINKTIAHNIMKGSREGYKLLEERLKKRINKLREALSLIGYPPNEWDDPSDIAINALDEDDSLAGVDKEK
jgi:hypothetical protein